MTRKEFIRRLKKARENKDVSWCLGCALDSVGLTQNKHYTLTRNGCLYKNAHAYVFRPPDWLRACIDNSIAELEKTR